MDHTGILYYDWGSPTDLEKYFLGYFIYKETGDSVKKNRSGTWCCSAFREFCFITVGACNASLCCLSSRLLFDLHFLLWFSLYSSDRKTIVLCPSAFFPLCCDNSSFLYIYKGEFAVSFSFFLVWMLRLLRDSTISFSFFETLHFINQMSFPSNKIRNNSYRKTIKLYTTEWRKITRTKGIATWCLKSTFLLTHYQKSKVCQMGN